MTDTPSLAQVTAGVLDTTLDLIAAAYTDITVEAGAAVDQARTEVHGNVRVRVQLTVCRVGDYPQLSGEVEADIAERCQTAHPEDRTPCVGPLDAVTVLDAHNRGTEGCEHHAARLLASLKGGRVYSGSVPHAALTVFRAAADLPPFAWTVRGQA